MEKIPLYIQMDKDLYVKAQDYTTQSKVNNRPKTDSLKGLVEVAVDSFIDSNPIPK
jgi:hypothetical protein